MHRGLKENGCYKRRSRDDAFLQIWAAVGPILGILIGGLTAWAIQRAQWLRDRKLEEYRELLNAMNTAAIEQLDSGTSLKTKEAFKSAGRVFADRIFIRDDMEELDAEKNYMSAVKDFDKDEDRERFGERVDVVRNALIKKAKKI